MISDECRRESNESVDKYKRYLQIKEILLNGYEMTAKEVACEMYKRGYTDSNERNYAAPRLTELEKRYRLIKVVGKKKCQYSGKKVSIYKLILDDKLWEQLRFEAF